MCARTRGNPAVGAEVTILSLGDPERGVVVALSDERTELTVEAESGESIAFRLRSATGRFESADGRRIRFDE